MTVASAPIDVDERPDATARVALACKAAGLFKAQRWMV